jgi:hypothetical protein
MKLFLSLYMVLALLADPGASGSEGGVWTRLAPMNLLRQEMGAARIGDRVYVTGGLTAGPPSGVTNTVEVYDIRLDRWDPVAPLPVGLDHMGVAATGGCLYVVGGFDASRQRRTELRRYDPDLDAWTTLAPLPSARGACWATEHGGKIYVFGGSDDSGTNRAETFIYDPGTDQWAQGANLPTPRNHLVAVSDGTFLYVLGGRAPLTAANERYDPVQDEWVSLAPLPTPRSAMGAAFFSGKIYVAGGESPLFDENEIYDIASNTWSCGATMAIPRHGLGAVALDDRILFPAGGLIQGFGPTDAVDAFIPEEVCTSLEVDALRVNGSAGTVVVPVSTPVELTLAASASGPDPARYLLWVWRGSSSTPVALDVGGSLLGCAANPTPLQPGLLPQPYRCLRSPALPARACQGIVEITGPAAAPWSIQSPGLANPATFHFQAILEDDGAAHPTGFSVTNRVVLRLEAAGR